MILLLIGEALSTFILVTVNLSIFVKDHVIALLLGSIAMATAPAATKKILSDYKAEGSLSSTNLFIIAFDDILAIIFFNTVLAYAVSSYSSIPLSVTKIVLPVLTELLGSVVSGIVLALALKPFHKPDIDISKTIEITFPTILICIVLAGLFHFSSILSTIILGQVLASQAKCDYQRCYHEMKRLSNPIIALFFILIGFELN